MRMPYQVLIFPFMKEKGKYYYAVFKRKDLDFWQGISGGGENNETPIEAARREAFEEARIYKKSKFIRLDSMTTIPVVNVGDYEAPRAYTRGIFSSFGVAKSAEAKDRHASSASQLRFSAKEEKRKEGVFVLPEYSFGVEVSSTDLEIGKEHSRYRWLTYDKAKKLLKYDSNKSALWELDYRLTKNQKRKKNK